MLKEGKGKGLETAGKRKGWEGKRLGRGKVREGKD